MLQRKSEDDYYRGRFVLTENFQTPSSRRTQISKKPKITYRISCLYRKLIIVQSSILGQSFVFSFRKISFFVRYNWLLEGYFLFCWPVGFAPQYEGGKKTQLCHERFQFHGQLLAEFATSKY